MIAFRLGRRDLRCKLIPVRDQRGTLCDNYPKLIDFEFQDMINASSLGTSLRPSLGMDSVYRLQTRSSLRTLVLWELGSDSDIQRLVSNADPQTLADPVVQYHLGIRFIAERNYEAAVEPLRRAAQVTQLRADAIRLRTYALCMSVTIPTLPRVPGCTPG